MPIAIEINGRIVEADAENRTLLVEFIREHARLTGTHIGCDTSYCGACTVLLDGRAVKSCTLLAVQACGAKVRTIEGLEQADGLHPLQASFARNHALQCGYCTPGFLLSSLYLLSENPEPDDAAIRKGLAGNTCRCTGYLNIINAVKEAATTLRSVKS